LRVRFKAWFSGLFNRPAVDAVGEVEAAS